MYTQCGEGNTLQTTENEMKEKFIHVSLNILFSQKKNAT